MRTMCRLLLIGAAALTLAGCMNPNDPDTQTHCLVSSMCLDIPANRGDGPGFWGTAAALSAPRAVPATVYVTPAPIPPPPPPVHVNCYTSGPWTSCNGQ
jgi:hypothetical protein